MSEGKKDGSVGKAVFGALGALVGVGLAYTTYKLAQENKKLVNDYNNLVDDTNRLSSFINDHDFYEKPGIDYTVDSEGVSVIAERPKHHERSAVSDKEKSEIICMKNGMKLEKKIIDHEDYREEITTDLISGLKSSRYILKKQA